MALQQSGGRLSLRIVQKLAEARVATMKLTCLNVRCPSDRVQTVCLRLFDGQCATGRRLC